MDVIRGLLARLRAIALGRRVDRDLEEEIDAHIEMETARNVAQGKSPGEARRLAHAVFGGRDAVLEAHRDVRGGRWVSDVGRDVRFAFRTLRNTMSTARSAAERPVNTVRRTARGKNPSSRAEPIGSPRLRFRPSAAMRASACGIPTALASVAIMYKCSPR